jgi:hypothetical protein
MSNSHRKKETALDHKEASELLLYLLFPNSRRLLYKKYINFMLSFNRSTDDKQRQNQVTTTDVGEEAKRRRLCSSFKE